ncbi:GNAT family N-acetyltransferase [Ferdinandcohnia sp. Marseille-Q9671]
MKIREIKKEDNPRVKEIIQESLKSHGLAIPGTAYYDPQLNDLHHYYHNLEHAKYWVIEHEGEVVGGIGIAPFNEQDKVCELQKLYVDSKMQGLGYGKKLMETALSFASQYYETCYLETTNELKTACILYEKFGFTRLQEPLPGSDHSAMDAWYVKDLTDY